VVKLWEIAATTVIPAVIAVTAYSATTTVGG